MTRCLQFSQPSPGYYSVKVSAPGFETVIKTGIELQVQQTARVDFRLRVGQSTQTVEVQRPPGCSLPKPPQSARLSKRSG